MNLKNDRRGANVRFPPPLITAISILAAYVIHRLAPLPLWPTPALTNPGLVIILAGIIVGVFFFIALLKAGTHVEPWRPTTRLVTDGIYAYTRNPAYLSFCIITIGLGFVYNSVWILLSCVPSAYLIWHFVIKKEERYLEAKFGGEYLEYKNCVRRWL